MSRKLLLLILILKNCWGFCQVVSGTVTDFTTKEPIPFANVFFGGTLIGTSTDLEGAFTISHHSEGKYELVVSYVGYEDFIILFDAKEENTDFQIELKNKVIELDEVSVSANNFYWKYEYPRFERFLISETKNAKKTTVENPKDVFIFFDEENQTLYAHSNKELIITNKGLGYQIFYRLSEFEMNKTSFKMTSFGIPRFKELKAKNEKQDEKWIEARQKAYQGSFPHLLRSIRNNTFIEDGFELKEVFRIPNRERPSEDLLTENIVFYRTELKKEPEASMKSPNMKKLLEWYDLAALPLYVDSLGTNFTTNEKLLDEEGDLAFTGILKVIYREKEEKSFAASVGLDKIFPRQKSYVHFSETLEMHENGYYDSESLFFEGYLSWSSRLAEMLPLEYHLGE